MSKLNFKAIVFLIALITGIANAQIADNHVIRVGYYIPQAAKSGMILGYQTGKAVDDRVSYGFSVDLYTRKYVEKVEIDTTGLDLATVNTNRVNIDFSTYMLPIQANVIVNMPVDVSGMSPYVSGGLGFAFLLNRELNYINDEKDTRFFSAFVWNLAGGVSYELGTNSAARFELFYNRALLKGARDKTEAGFPIYDELNMSGLGLRLGLVMDL
ncbi:MAG: hypothetical protein HQ528_01955 [Candidatus Marinimicrobia bacterium]|nr:hypothetical protein [Candidatus Neomarinimicrobiota bacterium]